MTISTRLLTAMAFLVMAQAAQAAPKVSGKYALMQFIQCGATIDTNTGNFAKPGGGSAPAVETLTSGTGEIAIAVGTITFPSAAVSSGNASIEMSFVGGDVLRVDGNGSPVGTQTQNQQGTFALSNTSFSFTPNGQPAETWTMRFADLAGGVARTFYLVRREDAKCLQAITATKQ